MHAPNSHSNLLMQTRAVLSANRLIDRKMRIRTLEMEKRKLSHY